MAHRVLVVDDDHQVTDFLQRFLVKQGFHVVSSGSATQMGLAMEHDSFDIIILDVGLPDADGFQILRDLRRDSSIPIILLTVRDDVYDKVVGLEIGADDYVPKPFEPRELLARMRSVLRRTVSPEPKKHGTRAGDAVFSGFRLQSEKRRVTAPDGAEMSLTSTEYTLLVHLVQHAGETVSRDSLMNALYGYSIQVTDRAIDAHVSRLRRKLDAAGGHGGLIKTVHGRGYCLADRIETPAGR
ncbi:response regulator transcription factor [Thalassococcus sp. CAU 1522]|uniref:Response regulator transcription factor n=1 Tax=Thalassococcus arenae TaxID=2851652 RepID=A0ABS6N339_9RHOB|nr:response regulator transcription factor [Thalassococcus arenae]MBV2358426.1 response regulator transcription factor [Thalassococcus arenae]